MNPSLKLISLSVLASLVLTACGSTQTIEKDQLANVKKVAIIGFGVEQEQPNSAAGIVKAMMEDDEDRKMPNPLPNAKPDLGANQMYGALRETLTKRAGWKVLTHPEVRDNASYREFFVNRTSGMQPRPLARKNAEAFIPEGIVEGFLLTNLSEPERTALIRKMGVDAVVVTTLYARLTLDSNVFQKMVGAGKLRRSVGVRFAVFKPGVADAVWFDMKSQQDAEETVDATLGFAASNERLAQITLATAKKTFEQIAALYP